MVRATPVEERSDAPSVGRPTTLARVREAARSEEFWPLVGLAVAMVLGIAIRLYYVLPAGFPLNDGGLFFAMARDLREAGYALPEYASYNTQELPFAYSPLFIYVLAFLDDVTPLSAFDLLWLLPLLASVATIPVFYVIARTFLTSKVGVVVAVLVFATIQNGFEWHIMGGGLTRAPALLFSLLTIIFAYRAYCFEGWRQPIFATVFASLALLSHPDAFVVISVALLFVVYGRNRRGLRTTIIIAGGVALLTAPWWGTVIARHGLETILSAAGSRTEQGWGSSGSLLPWRHFLDFPFTKQPLLNWPAVLAILGAGAALASAQFFAPLWLAAEVLVEPHQSANFVHAPVALLVGFAAGRVIAPAWRHLSANQENAGAETFDASEVERLSRLRRIYGRLGAGLVAGYFVVVMLFSVLNEPDQLDHLEPLEQEQRQLMAWVDGNTPQGAPFMVVSGLPWWGDRVSEWFPALTHGHSLFTPQGSEWFGETFTERIEGHGDLQECADTDEGNGESESEGIACLDDVAEEYDVSFEYVYIASSCCSELIESVRTSSEYRIVHEGSGGVIARHVDAEPG